MRAAEALIFDFNGTLSDDEPLLCRIYRELFAEHGRPLTEREYYDELAGLSEEAIIGGWLGVGGVALETLVGERIARYRELAADGSTVLGPTRAAVRHAARRVPLAIVSGAFRAEIDPVIEAAGLASSFRVAVTADDVMEGKPHPEGYLRALEALGADPRSTVAFEDTEAGVASAAAAGVYVVAVLGTLPVSRLERADEHVTAIDTPLIERLLG